MRRRTRLVLSALTGVAVAALFVVYASDVRAEADAAQREVLERFGGEVAPVCVAIREIEPGEEIDEGNVRVEEWAASLLPAGALTSLSDAVGKTATSRIPKQAPLSDVYFERHEDAARVPDKLVAVSVPSDEEHAVGGVLARGDRVEVYVMADGVANRLTSAEVLDTSALAEGDGDMSWVTLAVEPSVVEELLAAMSVGTVSLVAPGADAALATSGADDAASDEDEAGTVAPDENRESAPLGDSAARDDGPQVAASDREDGDGERGAAARAAEDGGER